MKKPLVITRFEGTIRPKGLKSDHIVKINVVVDANENFILVASNWKMFQTENLSNIYNNILPGVLDVKVLKAKGPVAFEDTTPKQASLATRTKSLLDVVYEAEYVYYISLVGEVKTSHMSLAQGRFLKFLLDDLGAMNQNDVENKLRLEETLVR